MKKIIQRIDYTTPLFFVGLLTLFNIRLAYFVSNNIVYLYWKEVSTAFVLQILCFFVTTFIIRLFASDWKKTLQYIMYVTVFWLMGNLLVIYTLLGNNILLVALFFFILCIFYIIHYLHQGDAKTFRIFVSVFSFILFAMQLPALISLAQSDYNKFSFNDVEAKISTQESNDFPHIIYIIPDRYSSNETLEQLYNYSNKTFSDSLEQRGFYVWKNQYSNYPKTFQSIASTLNMNYLDSVTDELSDNTNSYVPIYELMHNYQAQRLLARSGYDYTHIGSWWGPTKTNAHADVNFNSGFDGASEFTLNYMATTPLLLFTVLRNHSKKDNCESLQDQLQLIKKQVKSDKPQFIFWHTLLTHDPYIFNDDGTCRAFSDERYFNNDYEARKRNYLQHIGHFNRYMLELFDTIQETSKREFVFVIQADEGPFPEDYLKTQYGIIKDRYDFWNAPLSEKQRKHSVFNAMYLPGQKYSEFHIHRTPVNNFRLIFNSIYQLDLPLLDDKILSFQHEKAPYVLKDVTHELLEGN